MLTVDSSIVIAAPVERVFDYVADYRNATTWMRNFSRFEPVGEKAYGLGARSLVEGTILGVPFRTELQVVEFVRCSRLTSRSTGSLRSLSRWLFKPVANGTEVSFSAQYQPPRVIPGPEPARHLLQRELRKGAEQSLLNLKRAIE